MSSRSPEPPRGGVWDVPLDEATLAFVDLEMTGLDAKRHRVIEMCIAQVVGGNEVARLETYVRPDPLPESVGNHHVHGIGRESLEGAPKFSDLAEQVRALLEPAILVAHGARWDIAFLEAEMHRLVPTWRVGAHIDTVALARRVMKADNYKLSTLAAALDIHNDNPHRAGSDVMVTRALFDRLVERMDPDGSNAICPRNIWDRCAGKRIVTPGILEAATEAIERGEVMSVRYKPARRGEQQLEFVVTSVRRDLDPPVVLGYLHSTRGRRELRADRILSIEPTAK